MPTEMQQIEQAILALEGQRAALGDAVVEVALAPLRAKLAELQAQAVPPEQKRKQVTVLFADVSGFTAMSETLDPEEVTEIMNALWERLDAVITTHGGQIDKHIGDCVMALWGVDAVREDDAGRAVQAALKMQAALALFREERGVRLAMRIGLNTGPVLLGEVGSKREFTAMGDAVNLASRMEHAAPVDGILITHDTYRQVRGAFDLVPQAPLAVKGKSEPVQTYVVQAARQSAFRSAARGIEGIETRMVGRDAEFLALQNAYIQAAENCQARLLTLMGEAGVGKSRLLLEFARWVELRPEAACIFKGRAVPAAQNTPLSILRDMFAYRFNILESDGPAQALEKFRGGVADRLTPDRADLVGHWVGFDFSASPAVKNLSGDASFGKLARAYLTNYLRALAEGQPVLLFLEDIHWADDSSLELIDHLVTALPHARLLVVALARPALFERRPQWGQDGPECQRIDLQQLSRQASGDFVDEMLQKMAIPSGLIRDLIVDRADGNPLYMEELLKMLFEEGVIERGPEGSGAWRANLERLNQVHVPPTLTGILQARLDSLPRQEREPLQRAAVVGRLFWDAAVAEISGEAQAPVSAAIEAARSRSLIYGRESSAFAGTQEYIFKHALLHDVVYETVLLKLRRAYHAQVARWLEARAGQRVGEYAALIADHLERAGQAEEAARYLRKAGERALTACAAREALQFFRRALSLLPETSPDRAGVTVMVGRTLAWVSEFDEAQKYLEQGLALSRTQNDDWHCALALRYLGVIAYAKGEWAAARDQLAKGLEMAGRANDRVLIISIRIARAWVDVRQGLYPEAKNRFLEVKAYCEDVGAWNHLPDIYSSLGTLAAMQENYEEAHDFCLKGLMLAREKGDRTVEAAALSNVGEIARLRKDYPTARQYGQEALALHKEIGDRRLVVLALTNLGHVASALGDYPVAIADYCEALELGLQIQVTPRILEILCGWAGVLARTGQPEHALPILGLALAHPALQSDGKYVAEEALNVLRSQCPPEVIEAGLRQGQSLRLEMVAADLLNQKQATPPR